MGGLAETSIEDRNRVQPHHANNPGTARCGNLLRWTDETGTTSATRFAGKPCMTAHTDSVDFDRPLDIGGIALVGNS